MSSRSGTRFKAYSSVLDFFELAEPERTGSEYLHFSPGEIVFDRTLARHRLRACSLELSQSVSLRTTGYYSNTVSNYCLSRTRAIYSKKHVFYCKLGFLAQTKRAKNNLSGGGVAVASAPERGGRRPTSKSFAEGDGDYANARKPIHAYTRKVQ